MSRIIGAIAMSCFLAAAAAAQSPPPQVPPAGQTKNLAEVTLHGCVIQGETPGMFLFRNAVDPARKGDTPKIYRLTSQIEDPDFTSVANKLVTATGIPENKPQPKVDQKIVEKDLPAFSVSKFEALSDVCPTAK